MPVGTGGTAIVASPPTAGLAPPIGGTDTGLSTTNATAGTVDYMTPERYRPLARRPRRGPDLSPGSPVLVFGPGALTLTNRNVLAGTTVPPHSVVAGLSDEFVGRPEMRLEANTSGGP